MAVSREWLEELDDLLGRAIETVEKASSPEWQQIHNIADAYHNRVKLAFLQATRQTQAAINIGVLTRYVQAEFDKKRLGKRDTVWAVVHKMREVFGLFKAALRSDELDNMTQEDWLNVLPNMTPDEINQALQSGALDQNTVITYWLNKFDTESMTGVLRQLYNSGLMPDVVFAVLLARVVGRPISSAAGEAAAAAAANLQKFGIKMDFSLKDPLAQAWIKQYTANRVVQVTSDTKMMIRGAIDQAFDKGGHPYQTAAQIRQFIGLTSRQTASVQAQTAKLAATGQYQPDQLAMMTQAMTTKKKIDRSLNIARTETINAAYAGQQAAWESALDKGLLDPDRHYKKWIVTNDDRLCPPCAAMDGKKVPIKEQFHSDDFGDVDGPALHPQCRCAAGIVETGGQSANGPSDESAGS
jgi:hypothetical protein